MGKKHINSDKQIFFNTIQDIRKLVGQHRGNYAKDTMGLNKTNTKVPFTHLQGRRKKLHTVHDREKERAREQVIQYDSSMKLLNSDIMEVKKDKDQFERNRYKFEQISSGRVGKEKNGMLSLNRKDIDRIYGKTDQKKKIPKQGKEGGKKFKKHKGIKRGKGRK